MCVAIVCPPHRKCALVFWEEKEVYTGVPRAHILFDPCTHLQLHQRSQPASQAPSASSRPSGAPLSSTQEEPSQDAHSDTRGQASSSPDS